MPEISVLLSVHNGEHFLAEAIESVLNQTYSDFEFIIINDGSEDGTSLIIEHFRERDKRIYYYEKGHTGLANSLNAGLARSKSSLIARIDADDIWKPTKLETQLSFLKDHREIVLLGSSVEFIDETGTRLNRKGFNNNIHFDSGNIKKALYRKNLFCHSSVIFNKGIVEDIGGYNEGFKSSTDYDLWVNIVSQHNAGIISEQLVQYRIWKGMISLRNPELQIRESISIRNKAFEILGVPRYKRISLLWDQLVLWFWYLVYKSRNHKLKH